MRTLASFIALLFLLAANAVPQTQAINGSIRGQVLDQAGAPIAAARVDAVNDATGFARSQETQEDGYYVVANLPLGSYTVSIQKSGFASERHTSVVLDAGTTATIDAHLKVGEVSTSIEVTGGAPIIEPDRVSTGRIITNLETDNMPLTSRNPYNFILFQPGVSGHPNPELGIPRLLNTNGLVDHVNYQLDGTTDTESDRTGLRLFAIADNYVSEVQVVSNSFSPEFGRIAGNIYNVITQSGSNQFHGQAQYLGRPLDLVARPILATPATLKPIASDYFGNLGGRLIKDKLFFFASYENVKRSVPSPTTITTANAAAIGLSPSLLANPPAIEHAQWVDARLDWSITQKHQFFVRYNYFRNRYPFNTNDGGLFALDAASDFRDRAHVAGAQLLSTFSPTVLNELRFGWPYRNEQHLAGPLTGKGPEITISGIANFGGSTAVGDRFQEKIPNLNDNFTVVKGPHTFKAGVGFQQNLDTQAADIYTQYIFPSIAAYQSGLSGVNPFAYGTFNASVGEPGAWYHSFFWDAFLQDTWKALPNLTVVYGVRYDKFDAPPGDTRALFPWSQNFRTPGANFAPRLGIAWSINPKTVLRVSSGIFYEAPPTNLWYNAIYNDGGSASYIASIASSAAGAPAFPTSVVNGTLPRSSQTIYTVTPTFKNDYAINSSFQLARQLSQSDSLTLGFANVDGRHLQYLRNLNLINPTGFLADGRPVFSTTANASTRLYPQFNNIALQDIGANSSYNALIVNYQRRLKYGVAMNASYTFSHSISDAPEGNAYDQGSLFIEDPTNRERDRGNSVINRPHAFTLTSILQSSFAGIQNRALRTIVNGNQLAILANLSSGDQQNLISNRVLNGDSLAGASVTRPLGVGRNTLRTPSVYQVDARYSRSITLWERVTPQFFLEANNIFNHPNITSINTTATVNAAGVITTSPTLAPTSTLLEGRIVQLGIKVNW